MSVQKHIVPQLSSVLVVVPVRVWRSATQGAFRGLPAAPETRPASLTLTWAGSARGASAATQSVVVASWPAWPAEGTGTQDWAALSCCAALQPSQEPLSGPVASQEGPSAPMGTDKAPRVATGHASGHPSPVPHPRWPKPAGASHSPQVNDVL